MIPQDYEPLIGLEIHTQLSSKTKLLWDCGFIDWTLKDD